MTSMKLEDIAVHDERSIRGFCGEYRWLSNFWPCKIQGLDVVYPSVEHAYQAAKAPIDERHRFVGITAAQAKRLGSTFNLDRAEWDIRKDTVMVKALCVKFTDHWDLALKLISTDDRHLEELNVWKDRYWGVYDGDGQNRLGRMLMAVRANLMIGTHWVSLREQPRSIAMTWMDV